MTARALKRRARAKRRLLNSYRAKRVITSVRAETEGMQKPACTWHNWLAEESLYDGESRQLCPLWHHAGKESPVA